MSVDLSTAYGDQYRQCNMSRKRPRGIGELVMISAERELELLRDISESTLRERPFKN